ncbi:MAG: UDP-N-acetylmuramate dehydrogenase [Gloeomargaritaceae cyanobacterium C42_A2020_066]|nr:UDP-N-acetylmuramate dehydrogenase [Gloeomargaritaceae cyanobacterium C42_A2020_066]
MSADLPPGIRAGVSLAGWTTYRVGGPAEWLATPRTFADLKRALDWGQDQGLPVTLIGCGSNLLISDQGLPGLVISTRYLREVIFDEAAGRVWAAAGVPLPHLAKEAARRGWQGLEWAVGIPGTVGGAVVMNAGAHQRCVADLLVAVDALTPTGMGMGLTADQMDFAYRYSRFQSETAWVAGATLQLQPGGDPVDVLAATEAQLAHRRQSQPYDLPSCGSVFRNPSPRPAGWLIEQSGLKGYQIGQAQVAHRHANFIVNLGGATAQDVLRLIHHVQAEVERCWALALHPEVKVLGTFQPV